MNVQRPSEPEPSPKSASELIVEMPELPNTDDDDTEPLPLVDPFATFGSSRGPGGSGTRVTVDRAKGPERRVASGPLMGDLELPPPLEPFAFPTSYKRRARGDRTRIAFLGIGALATLATVGGLTFWLTHRSVPAGESTDEVPASVPTTQQTKSTPASRRDAEAEARLLQSLSPGYAPGVCEPVEPEPGASAMVNCGTNTDPGGPTSATYTLALDKPALDRVLADAVTADSVLICPGNIQSPGPWRRNATPDKISGTLVCGLQRNVPAIAWSDEERMLVAAIRSDPPGPSLDQLFAWWSTHS